MRTYPPRRRAHARPSLPWTTLRSSIRLPSLARSTVDPAPMPTPTQATATADAPAQSSTLTRCCCYRPCRRPRCRLWRTLSIPVYRRSPPSPARAPLSRQRNDRTCAPARNTRARAGTAQRSAHLPSASNSSDTSISAPNADTTPSATKLTEPRCRPALPGDLSWTRAQVHIAHADREVVAHARLAAEDAEAARKAHEVFVRRAEEVRRRRRQRTAETAEKGKEAAEAA